MFRCVSCGSKRLRNDQTIHGYLLKKCSWCGLLITQTNTADRLKYVHEKYSGQYIEDYPSALPKLHRRFSKHFSLIRRHKTGGRWLDVGCGTGYFLKFLKGTDSGWRVFGIEPNTLLRKLAKKISGATITDGTMDRIPFDDGYFDMISCYDVLEHSAKLKKNMQELKRVLKPDGLLLIQAPNYRSVMAFITGARWDWWCIPDHILHFSYASLVHSVRNNGFAILRSYTYEDPADFISNVKSMFRKYFLTKAIYCLLLPLFLTAERIGWFTHLGGLTVVIARKE
ncbi:MAG TPA: class I SAM-dependent methyltransferase [Patescibacteria group bacterium]|nr:class I SAM-dependent methyltransferase [Patescibacteria group bacterium]